MVRVVLLLLLAAGVAHADGGTVRIREDAGAFRVTVFSAPEPLRVGRADLSVLVQRRDGEAPVLDAEILLRLAGPPPVAPIEVRATREAATNKWLHAALVEIPVAGTWTLRARVRDGSDTAEVATEIEVSPRLPALFALWPYLVLPPLAVAAFAVREWLTRRRAASIDSAATRARRAGSP